MNDDVKNDTTTQDNMCVRKHKNIQIEIEIEKEKKKKERKPKNKFPYKDTWRTESHLQAFDISMGQQ